MQRGLSAWPPPWNKWRRRRNHHSPHLHTTRRRAPMTFGRGSYTARRRRLHQTFSTRSLRQGAILPASLQGLSKVGSLRKGHTLPPTWIPACAGMTVCGLWDNGKALASLLQACSTATRGHVPSSGVRVHNRVDAVWTAVASARPGSGRASFRFRMAGVRFRRPTAHTSCSSARQAPTRRRTAGRLGKRCGV